MTNLTLNLEIFFAANYENIPTKELILLDITGTENYDCEKVHVLVKLILQNVFKIHLNLFL